MPTPELAKQAEAVRADIARLDADLKTLLNTVGGAVAAAITRRVNEPMQSLSSHIGPLLNMLGAASAPMKRGPGRPSREERETRTRGGTRGGRGNKANLTPEAIAAALDQTGGNKAAAARLLGVSQPTFYKYLGATTDSGAKKQNRSAAPARKPRPKPD